MEQPGSLVLGWRGAALLHFSVMTARNKPLLHTDPEIQGSLYVTKTKLMTVTKAPTSAQLAPIEDGGLETAPGSLSVLRER